MTEARVEAWRVHDTGLVAVPSRFRRLGGLVRHHQGQGDHWPDRVVLTIDGGELRVAGPGGPIGTWPLDAVVARPMADGPPTTFTLDVPGGAHLLAAAADDATRRLLARLTTA